MEEHEIVTHLHGTDDKRGPLDVNLINRFHYLSSILNGSTTAVFIPPFDPRVNSKHIAFDTVDVRDDLRVRRALSSLGSW